MCHSVLWNKNSVFYHFARCLFLFGAVNLRTSYSVGILFPVKMIRLAAAAGGDVGGVAASEEKLFLIPRGGSRAARLF